MNWIVTSIAIFFILVAIVLSITLPIVLIKKNKTTIPISPPEITLGKNPWLFNIKNPNKTKLSSSIFVNSDVGLITKYLNLEGGQTLSFNFYQENLDFTFEKEYTIDAVFSLSTEHTYFNFNAPQTDTILASLNLNSQQYMDTPIGKWLQITDIEFKNLTINSSYSQYLGQDPSHLDSSKSSFSDISGRKTVSYPSFEVPGQNYLYAFQIVASNVFNEGKQFDIIFVPSENNYAPVENLPFFNFITPKILPSTGIRNLCFVAKGMNIRAENNSYVNFWPIDNAIGIMPSTSIENFYESANIVTQPYGLQSVDNMVLLNEEIPVFSYIISSKVTWQI